MKFGKVFEKESIEEWKQHYVQYNSLKKLIKSLEEKQQEQIENVSENGKETLIDASAFNGEVEGQLSQALEHYRIERQKLERKIVEAKRTKHLVENSLLETPQARLLNLEHVLLEFHKLGEQIIRLFHFLQLNSIAIRKIAKKFNKRIKSKGKTLLAKAREDSKSSIAAKLRRLKDYSLLEPSVGAVIQGITDIQNSLSKTDSEIAELVEPPSKHPKLSRVASVRYGQYLDESQIILADLNGIRDEMRETNSFLGFLSVQAAINFRPSFVRTNSMIRSARSLAQQGFDIENEQKQKLLPPLTQKHIVTPKIDSWSEYINLASTFFYLANYNVCLPTSGMYALHLGLRAETSGIIVAMTPVAALISAVLYSYWSNFSFKAPLMCSSSLLIVGNILYALAWDTNLTSLILLGRFVCGLGGARAVNRRYIADTIPVENRTKASAAFVAAGAIGMASGPFLASLFADVDTQILGFTFNEMTAPAWFMAFIWVLFGLLVLVKFQEPSSHDQDSPETGVKPILEEEFEDDTSDSIGESDAEYLGLSDDDDDFDDDDTAFDSASENGEAFDDSLDIVLGGKQQTNYGTSNDLKSSNSYVRLAKANRKQKVEKRRWRLTLLSLWIIFWVKLIQEALLTGIPIVAPDAYGWGTGKVGVFMTALGLSVVPCNSLLVIVSKAFDLHDTFWLRTLKVPLIFFCLLQVSFAESHISRLRFIIGDFGVFTTAQVLEGVIMSYFSKIISKKLAAGTFNSGLLATEAGTLGRAAGNAVITILGEGGPLLLERNLYLFGATMSFFTWLASVRMLSK